MKTDKQDAPVNLLDVAREAGVSRATASLVLRNSPLVAAATRERVQQVMQRLGYIYNRGAANLRQNRTNTIGLVLSNISNPFFSTLTAGVEEANDASEIVCFIADSAESPERQARQIQRLREHNIDGLILCPAVGSDERVIADLDRLGLPFVQVLREIPGCARDYVTVDYAAGIDEAMAHLVTAGRRRIVFIGNFSTHSAARARLEGFNRAAARLGLPSLPVIAGGRDNRYDEAALDEILASSEPPEAAICYNDIIALAVMGHLRRRAIGVGSDFSVIGMDDLSSASASYPALTTIATMPHRVGEAAARLLQKRISRPAKRSEQLVITPRLIVRESA
ncbi:LacI family DNA-binding transcriptional regulator [Asaia krungthepensis]|uniref:LacI family transcriptional regulator n=1 Tax=Asaia krungthepensis NRIC 0535 TaxID=1307925 RepID=A0ABQ0PX70_9PROT|nr:LacI family DNA-binding transcriptional regulator [Asaia krungthepensis]GBQ83848.1 LacI family transcriptional regulator [Asaia krungthepensis NRIC 0535]